MSDWRKRQTPFRSTPTPTRAGPRPGGRTLTWTLSSTDLLERAIRLLNDIEDATSARDPGRVQALVAELTSLPGFPRHQPGDHFEMEVRRPVIVIPN